MPNRTWTNSTPTGWVVSGAVPAESYQDTAFNLGAWLTPEIFQEVKRWLFGL
jgi:hypothetical protein